jgi:hypothetical protein
MTICFDLFRPADPIAVSEAGDKSVLAVCDAGIVSAPGNTSKKNVFAIGATVFRTRRDYLGLGIQNGNRSQTAK